MNIIGPDCLVFGVDDLDLSSRYAADFGLLKVEGAPSGAMYEALDGTSIKILKATDASLATAIASSPNIRETVYGVADPATLQAIGAELSRDRPVVQSPDGVLHSRDDDGYPLGFQVTVRHAIAAPPYGVNVPGQAPGRALNVVMAKDEERPKAYTLSHVVLFTQDKLRAERFYADRLGFRTVDVFNNLGPFMRPAGNTDHHSLFLIEAPHLGLEHFAFHFAGANELLKAGWEFANKGYHSAWGPGRHIFGSNYFWYFNSPFGGKMEFDADMDRHDDSWVPRRVDATPPTSQTYLFEHVAKWAPGGDKKLPPQQDNQHELQELHVG